MSAIANVSESLSGTLLLDRSQEMFLDGQVSEAFHSLIVGLAEIRRQSTREEWRRFTDHDCLNHPLRKVLHQSPLSRRAYEKPRGYPGDAVILDYAYGCAALPEDTSELGAAIYECEREAPGIKSARDRRNVLASVVDTVARLRPYPRILSVACGHLREAQVSRAVAERMIGDYLALDQDAVSLSLIDREMADMGITTVQGSVRTLIQKKTLYNDLDLVYSAGLYDYLEKPVAMALTKRLFSMLRPGGRLLVANCATQMVCAGYMEAFMKWDLIYRDETEMSGLTASIPSGEMEEISSFRDLFRNMIFLEIIKR